MTGTTGTTGIHKTVCQVCHNCCPIEVEVADGRAVRITGNKNNRHFDGFSCGKGRRQLAYHYSPERLLQSRKRRPDGSFAPISSALAMDEIAERLQTMVAELGPRAVSIYFGTAAFQAAGSSMPLIKGFMNAIESPMVFDSVTIDQPGKTVARALHGMWLAPRHTPNEADVLMLIGANPLVSMLGLPSGNPGKWLNEKMDSGAELIVIDPRRTETARRATLFLQARPGHDVAVLAAMMKVILAEGLTDDDFLTANSTGVEALRRAVSAFSPEAVGRHAGLEPDDIVRAARMYGGARRGFTDAGTGPNMSQSGSLLEYMILTLATLCGHWHRAGDEVPDPLSLYPALPAAAQAMAPSPAKGFGEKLRVRGLTSCPAGLPVSALADEILMEGEGQVRALFSVGGNPVAAWPDQIRTVEAMRSLNLLVQIDPFMSQTAQYADYVIAPRMPLETPHVTHLLDFLQVLGIGPAVPYADYGAAVLDTPEGSDLLSEWEFFYGLAQRMGLSLEIPHPLGMVDPVPVDMTTPPTEEEMLDIVCAGSRIPLEVVRRSPDGVEGEAAAEPRIVVAPGDPDSEARLDVGNPEMMGDLDALAAGLASDEARDGEARDGEARDGEARDGEARDGEARDGDEGSGGSRMLLVSRREMHTANSSYNAMAVRGGRRHNPAFLNPEDAAGLGVGDDDLVRITSARASVTAVVSIDDSVRPGVVSMSHAYGSASPVEDDPWRFGSSTARLSAADDEFDRYSGQPRMSAIPVSVTVATPAQTAEAELTRV